MQLSCETNVKKKMKEFLDVNVLIKSRPILRLLKMQRHFSNAIFRSKKKFRTKKICVDIGSFIECVSHVVEKIADIQAYSKLTFLLSISHELKVFSMSFDKPSQ